jgi:hypothetical protein
MLFTVPGPVNDPCKCLPADINSSDVVTTQLKTGPTNEVKTVTVGRKLIEMRARCRKGKLVNKRGTEIHFVRMVGCWGNPPDNSEEILQRYATELAKLRKRYHVIELTCNPSGQPISKFTAAENLGVIRDRTVAGIRLNQGTP